MHDAFLYDGRHFVVYMSEGKMSLKLPMLRRRNLDEVLHLPYDSLKLNFRPTPPTSTNQTRYRLSLSTGLATQNGLPSPKKSPDPPPAPQQLPDPPGQPFLVQESVDRPTSQELRPRALPRPCQPSRGPPDLSGINVLQLELRQQNPAASSSWKRERNVARERIVRNKASPPVENGDVEDSSSTLTPPRPAGRLHGSSSTNSDSGPAYASNATNIPTLSTSNNRRSPGRSCQLPIPAPSRGDSRLAYPDPLTGASNSFHQRISEIALLEADTVRWERLRTYRRKPRPT